MARIVGVDLPRHKRGEVGLTYIYGGKSTAQKVLDEAGVGRDVKVQEWTDDQINDIRRILNEKYKLEGELRSETQLYKEAYGYWMLPWSPSQTWFTGQGTEHEEQCQDA